MIPISYRHPYKDFINVSRRLLMFMKVRIAWNNPFKLPHFSGLLPPFQIWLECGIKLDACADVITRCFHTGLSFAASIKESHIPHKFCCHLLFYGARSSKTAIKQKGLLSDGRKRFVLHSMRGTYYITLHNKYANNLLFNEGEVVS